MTLRCVSIAVVSLPAVVAQAGLRVVGPEARPDRLVTIEGERTAPCAVSFSVDGKAWRSATVYPSATVDGRRSLAVSVFNDATLNGKLPAGKGPVLWNDLFDVDRPVGSVRLRVRTLNDRRTLLEKGVDLGQVASTIVIDRRNVTDLAGGSLPEGWTLDPAGIKEDGVASITHRIARQKKRLHGKYYRYEIADADVEPLVLRTGATGWHRVYLGMEPYATLRFWLSEDDVRYDVPNYYQDGGGKAWADRRRLCQDVYLCSADLTGQDLCIAPGGSRFWRDVSVRYIRLVPMTAAEVAHHHRVRKLARIRGRPFMGYLEPCTPLAYEPEGAVGVTEHIRNEMRLNKARGSTDVAMHVIRIGSKAWYHSDVVERFDQPVLMDGPDPLAVGVAEAGKAGLRFLADFGMNATYVGSKDDVPDRFAREHPELLVPKYKMCFDYRHEAVREYVAGIVREVMLGYDVDGVHLDFARWGHRPAYDVASLVDTLERIHRDRREVEAKRARPMIVSVRVDYDAPPAKGAGDPVFLAAVKRWASLGLVDRVFVNGHKRVSEKTQLGHYVEALRGTRATLWADLYWGTWHGKKGGPETDLAVARAWVGQGLDGGMSYYMRARPIEWERINWQLRLVDFPDVVVDPHHSPPR